jgi:hypothetical protein
VIRADGSSFFQVWEAETVYGWFGGETSILHGVTSVTDIATSKSRCSIRSVNRQIVIETFIGTGYQAPSV